MITLRRIIFTMLFPLVLISCSSYKASLSVEANIRKVELGMTKSKVIKIMGDKYVSMRSYKSEDGKSVETLGYVSLGEDVYTLMFVDNILLEKSAELRVQRKSAAVAE